MADTIDVPLSRSRLTWGLSLFAMFTVAGLLVNLLYTSAAESLEALQQAHWGYLVVALLLPVVDWLSMGSRLYLLVHLLDSNIGWWTCVRADFANSFMGTLTPSQTGGGAAQIYVLVRAGMSLSGATIASLMSFVPTLVALGLLALGVLLFQETVSFGMSGRMILHYGVTAFGVVAGLVSLTLFLPGLSAKLVLRTAHWYVRVRRKAEGEPPLWAQTLAGGLEACRQHVADYLKHGKCMLLVGVVLTVFVFLVRHVIAYMVLHGLGGNASLGQVLVIQSIIVFLSYLSPTPGGSGVVEVSSTALMGRIVAPSLLPFFTVLWRFATLYLGAIVGGIVLLQAIRTSGNTVHLPASPTDATGEDVPATDGTRNGESTGEAFTSRTMQ